MTRDQGEKMFQVTADFADHTNVRGRLIALPNYLKGVKLIRDIRQYARRRRIVFETDSRAAQEIVQGYMLDLYREYTVNGWTSARRIT